MTQWTQILNAATVGDKAAKERLLNLVYEDLRQLAAARMRHEPAGHTLQATALVHEVYVKLLADGAVPWENRRHFYAAAGEAMRRILVDWARRRKRLKRGGGTGRREPLETDIPQPHPGLDPADLLAIDDALEKLRQMDPRMCEIVQMRVFAGMTISETAHALGLNSRTINREWAVARAWLARELGKESATLDLGPVDVADRDEKTPT
jgi:RNA polymerase sigma factor (TIGR02999 family)